MIIADMQRLNHRTHTGEARLELWQGRPTIPLFARRIHTDARPLSVANGRPLDSILHQKVQAYEYGNVTKICMAKIFDIKKIILENLCKRKAEDADTCTARHISFAQVTDLIILGLWKLRSSNSITLFNIKEPYR